MEENKRSKIPYIFVAFFAVVIAVNVFYIYISKQSWRGVVTEDAYQKGLKYNLTIEQVKKQEALGWKVDMKYSRGAPDSGILTINLYDKNSMPITNAQIYASFRRPTQEGFDFAQAVPFVNGVYNSKISFPLTGQWDCEVVITVGKDVYHEVKRYVIQ